MAVEEGYFTKQGLQVEPIKFETSNQALESLVAGRVDATAIVALEAALALEANTPDQFRIVEMSAATPGNRAAWPRRLNRFPPRNTQRCFSPS